jgi:predicted nucleic acid-binding protein
MIIVADSSALIALAIADGLHLLEQLFTEVAVTEQVYNECISLGKPQSEQLKQYLANKIYYVDNDNDIINGVIIDAGELSAMSLYKKMNADLLLIDDNQGRKVAKLNDVQVIGSVGVLILAKNKNIVASIRPYLTKISESNIFISQKIIDIALQTVGE